MLTSQDVLTMSFTQTKFRDGYDQDDVDDFLDRVFLTLRAAETDGEQEGPPDGPVTAQEARDVRFGVARAVRRMGYDMEEVDAFLARVVPALDAVASGAPAVVGATPPPPPASRVGTPGLIEPRRGWLARLLGG